MTRAMAEHTSYLSNRMNNLRRQTEMFVFKSTMKLRNYVFMYMNLQRSQNEHKSVFTISSLLCCQCYIYTGSTVVCTV